MQLLLLLASLISPTDTLAAVADDTLILTDRGPVAIEKLDASSNLMILKHADKFTAPQWRANRVELGLTFPATNVNSMYKLKFSNKAEIIASPDQAFFQSNGKPVAAQFMKAGSTKVLDDKGKTVALVASEPFEYTGAIRTVGSSIDGKSENNQDHTMSANGILVGDDELFDGWGEEAEEPSQSKNAQDQPYAFFDTKFSEMVGNTKVESNGSFYNPNKPGYPVKELKKLYVSWDEHKICEILWYFDDDKEPSVKMGDRFHSCKDSSKQRGNDIILAKFDGFEKIEFFDSGWGHKSLRAIRLTQARWPKGSSRPPFELWFGPSGYDSSVRIGDNGGPARYINNFLVIVNPDKFIQALGAQTSQATVNGRPTRW